MNTAQLKKTYIEEIAPALKKQFSYSSTMQIPVLKKIVINQGLGDATQDKKIMQPYCRHGRKFWCIFCKNFVTVTLRIIFFVIFALEKQLTALGSQVCVASVCFIFARKYKASVKPCQHI